MEVTKNKLIMIKEQSFKYDKTLSASTESIDFIRNIIKLQEEPEEVTILIALNAKNNIVGFCEVSRGTIDGTYSSGREVFKRAIIMNATKIILAHNHPSGDPTPSQADYQFTKSMKQTAELLGIKLIDHIVIGDTENYTIIFDKKI